MSTEPKSADEGRGLVRRVSAMPRSSRTALMVVAPGAVLAGGVVAAPLIVDVTGTATHLIGSAGEIGLGAGAVALAVHHLASASNHDSGGRVAGMLAGSTVSAAAFGTAIAAAGHLSLAAGAGIGAPAGLIGGFFVGCVASSTNKNGTPSSERRAAWLKNTALGGVSLGLGAAMVDAAEQVSRVHPVSGHALVAIGTGAAAAAGVAGVGAIQQRVMARRAAHGLGEG